MDGGEDLRDAAYELADAFREGAWPRLEGRPWEAVWAFLVAELELRCPGFGDEEYSAALNRGFTDSR